MEVTTTPEVEYPPLWKRLGATLIDLYFIFMLAYALVSIVPEPFADKFRLALFGLAVLYDPLCNSILGFTFGAFLFRFRVRDKADATKKLTFINALKRFVAKSLLGWLSFLTIHSDSRRRAIHDHVADSIVVAK